MLIGQLSFAQTADFTQTVVSGCSPQLVVFTDISANVKSRKWNLDNGNPDINDSLSVRETYSQPRTYLIRLEVEFTNGTKDVKTHELIIRPNPVPDFVANFTSLCAGTKVNFTDKSTTASGTIVDWKWDLELSAPTVQNPEQIYTAVRSYKAGLIVTNNWGCFATVTKPAYIRVVNKPRVDFTPNPLSLCTDTMTVFLANKSIDAPNYLWDFGDGQTSDLENPPPHFYSSPGTHLITLSSFVAPGCEDKKQLPVSNGKPTAKITDTITTLCEKVAGRFTGEVSPGVSSVYWLFGSSRVNGLQPSFAFPAAGIFEVMMIAVNSWGCADTVKKTVTVKPGAGINVVTNPLTTCENNLTVFLSSTNTDQTQFKIDFGDGSETRTLVPSHFYSAPGSYKLIIYDTVAGCVNSVTRSVNIGKPKLNFVNFRDTVCRNERLTFTGKIDPADGTGKWLFADKNQLVNNNPANYIFTNPGTYLVSFIGTNSWGCSDTISRNIYVSALPEPAFSLDTTRSCKFPFTVQTKNETVGNNYEFTWNFGDGTPNVKGFNPSHTYTREGDFDITLTVVDTSSTARCSATLIKRTLVHVNIPRIQIVPEPFRNCEPPVAINFGLTYQGFLDPPSRFIWKYGDGADPDTTISPNTSHLFNQVGSYQVTVNVESPSGCASSGSYSFNIIKTCPPPPDTVILSSGTCNPCNRLNLADTVARTTVTSWDFGDGTTLTTGNLKSVTHTFPAGSGSYNVRVERRNDITGQVSRTTTVIYVLCISPVIQADKFATCIGDTIRFSVGDIDSSLITNFRWDFGDNSGAEIINRPGDPFKNGSINHAFKTRDTFDVKLNITDINGCKYIAASFRVFIQGPQANFKNSMRTSCDSLFTVNFSDSTTLNNGIPIIKWIWNFGNGTGEYSSNQDTVISRSYPGGVTPSRSYTISLTVIDSFGCPGSVTKTNYISTYRPKASFSTNDTLHCDHYQVSFSNNSNATRPVYSWYLGDGNIVSATNPVFTYKRDGVYDVKLVVQDENGCRDSMQRKDYIKMIRPVAYMRVEDTAICWPKLPVTFKDSSLYAFSYLWEFENGLQSRERDRVKIYDAPGTYNARLIVTGPDGCKDTTEKQIRIKGAKGTAAADSIKGCLPFNAVLRVSNKINIESYRWTFGDGTGSSEITTDLVNHRYDRPGKYTPRVIYKSADGCETSDSTLPISIDYIKANFGVSAAEFCENGTVTIFDSSQVSTNSSIVKYRWDFGDGRTSVLKQPPAVVYNQSGTYNVQLAVESVLGCRDTFKLPALIKVYAPPVLQILGIDSACQGNIPRFGSLINSEDSIADKKWLLDGLEQGNNDSLFLPSLSVGTHRLTLQVRAKHGCVASSQKEFVIHPSPQPAANITHDTIVCVNSLVQLFAQGGLTYEWTPAATLQFPNSAAPVAKPLPGNTTYVVKISNIHGCVGRDSFRVKTDDSVSVRMNPNVSVCIGETVTLQAITTSKSFAWSPVDGLVNSNTLTPRVRPGSDIDYKIVVFSNNVCPNDTATVSIKVNPLPTVKASAAPRQVSAGQEVVLTAFGNGSNLRYQWSPTMYLSDPNAGITKWRADNDRLFTVKVTDQNGCTATDTVTVDVVCDGDSVFLPNAFTPAKSTNNLFRPISKIKNNARIERFVIANRWGNILYDLSNIDLNQIKGWDGTFNGKEQPEGTYVCYLKVNCPGQQLRKLAFILIR